MANDRTDLHTPLWVPPRAPGPTPVDPAVTTRETTTEVRDTRPSAAPAYASTVPASAPARVVETHPHSGARAAVGRIAQLVDYAFYLLYALLALRIALALLGARTSAGFTRFILDMSDPFYAPFRDIVASPASGHHIFDAPAAIALVAYAVLHGIIERGLRLLVERRYAA